MSEISLLFEVGEKNMEKTTGDLTMTAIHYFFYQEKLGITFLTTRHNPSGP